MTEPAWLDAARRLQAVAQNGLEFASGPYDRLRYAEVARVAAELMAAGTGAATEEVTAVFAAQTGYATPKVDVRGVVFRPPSSDGGRGEHGDELLLVREREDGRWTLPGGYADVSDSPAEAVVREIAEEAGYRARVRKLLACLDRTRHGHVPAVPFRIYKLFFACDVLDHVGADGIETTAVGWFARDDVPELSLGRVTAAQLDLVYAHHDDPSRPADFD